MSLWGLLLSFFLSKSVIICFCLLELVPPRHSYSHWNNWGQQCNDAKSKSHNKSTARRPLCVFVCVCVSVSPRLVVDPASRWHETA